jgi:hypothetical protein
VEGNGSPACSFRPSRHETCPEPLRAFAESRNGRLGMPGGTKSARPYAPGRRCPPGASTSRASSPLSDEPQWPSRPSQRKSVDRPSSPNMPLRGCIGPKTAAYKAAGRAARHEVRHQHFGFVRASTRNRRPEADLPPFLHNVPQSQSEDPYAKAQVDIQSAVPLPGVWVERFSLGLSAPEGSGGGNQESGQGGPRDRC